MTITRDAVIAIIAEQSGLDVTRLTPEAKLQDLNISSIDLVSAIFAIEEKFDVVITPDDVARDATLEELVDLVMSRSTP